MNDADQVVDGRTLRYRHRRPELLAAAVEYILEHGVTDLSIRPMAGEMGVSHGTLLRHFGSKEALVEEVVATIREELFGKLRSAAGFIGAVPPERSMQVVWHQLCEPKERRQFVLLFELVAMHARDSGRFESLTRLVVTDFLTAMEAGFLARGMSKGEARDLATGYLAMVRGLQLDLAVSRDRARVDAAMQRYIDLVTSSDA